MLIAEFAAVMENIAPKSLAMDFDNVGLLIGTEKRHIRKVLVALDCTAAVAHEAVEMDADLVLTHHPMFLNGIKRIAPDDPDTSTAYILIRNGIGHFAAHTNLDAAQGGVNDAICTLLGIENAVPIPPEDLGRVGSLKTSMPLKDFCTLIEQKMNTTVLTNGKADVPVSRIACIGGNGGGDIVAAVEAGADTFVTGEVRHHQALLAAELGLNVVVAGHYETEQTVLLPLIARLQQETIDVQYHLALSDKSPLARL